MRNHNRISETTHKKETGGSWLCVLVCFLDEQRARKNPCDQEHKCGALQGVRVNKFG